MPDADVEFILTKNQGIGIRATEKFVDVEGGIRAAKTTCGVAKTRLIAQAFPGIGCLLSRWTEDDTFAQLVPAWRAHAQLTGLTLKWHSEEGFDEIRGSGRGEMPNSRVYLCGLKTSDDTRRFAKLRGKNLAFVYIDQAEEVPVDVWHEVKGRLSQPGYPHQCLITPQPPTFDHWIADEFPEDNHRAGYRYIHTNVYDNRANIGDDYIAGLERDYPLGSAQRRTLLDGYRGLTGRGTPVYAGYFNRALHVRDGLSVDPFTPVIEAWDWGHGHPCVSWRQYLSIGAEQILGTVMGTAMFLEDFVPAALAIRREWIGREADVWSCGDPAGLDQTNQGARTSKVREILAEHGVVPISVPSANQPEVRYQATQSISARMRRIALDGQPAFRISPRAVVLSAKGRAAASFAVDGFEAGYVWDERRIVAVGNRGQIRVPKKDGYYDHFFNTEEYAEISYGPASPSASQDARSVRESDRRGPRDSDPADRGYGPTVRRTSRGGY